jgi:ATP-binding cassette subfamily B protein
VSATSTAAETADADADGDTTATDADATDGAAASDRRRRSARDLGRTIALTVRLAWQSEPRTFVAMVALSVLPATIPPIMVLLAKRLVDLVSARADPSHRLLPLVVALGLFAATQRVTATLIGTRQELFGRRVYLEAERRFLRHAASVDLGHFDDSDWHDRVARAKRDVSWRPGQMMWALIGMGGNLVTFVGMLGVLLTLHPVLVGLVLLSVVPSIVVQQRINKRIYSFWWVETPEDRERDYIADLMSQPRTSKEMRAFGLVDHFGTRHRQLGDNHYRKMHDLYRLYDRYAIGISLFSAACLALAYWFVGVRGLAGELTPGALTAVIAAFAAVTQQISLMTQSLISLDQHATFLNDYFEFLATSPLLPIAESAVPLPERLDGGVRFEGVHFTYPGGTEPALCGLDLHVRPGELVALVGDNGAGKTSIVKLLLRFYDPTAGRVTLGGVDLRDADPMEVRSRMGVLFQDYATYELSVRENVALGRAGREVWDGDVEGALSSARAEAVVKKLRGGLDAKVGRLFEGGHDLSGGEWQRLALARLLYREADVWVLDEPTSSLDPEAEAAIFAELRENLGGRMGLIISHRFSTVRIADRIAVIVDGKVQELGTHDELLARGGRYAELFELQAAGYR